MTLLKVKGSSSCLYGPGAIGILECDSTAYDIDFKVKIKFNIPLISFLLLFNTFIYLAPIICYRVLNLMELQWRHNPYRVELRIFGLLELLSVKHSATELKEISDNSW